MADEAKPGVRVINLKVRNQDGAEVCFRVKMTTPLGKLMEAYSQRVGIPADAIRFMVDGTRLRNTETPAEVRPALPGRITRTRHAPTDALVCLYPLCCSMIWQMRTSSMRLYPKKAGSARYNRRPTVRGDGDICRPAPPARFCGFLYLCKAGQRQQQQPGAHGVRPFTRAVVVMGPLPRGAAPSRPRVAGSTACFGLF